MERKKVNINTIRQMKIKGEKITFVTAYDYPFALLADRAGVDMILVGDSLAMTVLGYPNTLPVTMDEMISHTRAVRRAVNYAFLIGDMPYMSYQPGIEIAIRNAGRFMAEAGVDAVKLEGGEEMADRIEAIVKAGVPVMGHIGLTPQSASLLGGFMVQGKDAKTAKKLIHDAQIIVEAGAFAILLECIPAKVGKIITETLSIPVIGIGSGKDCDGQLLILHDMLGLFEAFKPKFAKQYINLSPLILKAFEDYITEVKEGSFPCEEHWYNIKEEEFQKLYEDREILLKS